MGNKLSCNCGPLSRKPYRSYEDTPWSAGSSSRSFSKRDGHLLRLWAEVFHVSSAGGGTVKWQQVSEDLVPVNITCIQVCNYLQFLALSFQPLASFLSLHFPQCALYNSGNYVHINEKVNSALRHCPRTPSIIRKVRDVYPSSVYLINW